MIHSTRPHILILVLILVVVCSSPSRVYSAEGGGGDILDLITSSLVAKIQKSICKPGKPCFAILKRPLVLLEANATVMIEGTYHFPNFRIPSESGPQNLTGCDIYIIGDAVVVHAQFPLANPKEQANYFSFVDNGAGTVIWGLYDKGKNEEWSGSGAGAARITYETSSNIVQFNIGWSGMASENFSAKKQYSSIKIECFFVEPPTERSSSMPTQRQSN